MHQCHAFPIRHHVLLVRGLARRVIGGMRPYMQYSMFKLPAVTLIAAIAAAGFVACVGDATEPPADPGGEPMAPDSATPAPKPTPGPVGEPDPVDVDATTLPTPDATADVGPATADAANDSGNAAIDAGRPIVDSGVDSSVVDAGRVDAGPADAGRVDAGPADAGRADAGPADAGRVDAGPAAPTWTMIYAKYFATGSEGSCASAGCHSTPRGGFNCGSSKTTCFNGLVNAGLIDAATPANSQLISAAASPLVWISANGSMPPGGAANPTAKADIRAWVLAGARNN
jgi:hypothetical protein